MFKYELFLSAAQAVVLLICFLFTSSALAKCECGYSIDQGVSSLQGIYTDAIEADFLHQEDVTADSDWIVQNYQQSSKPYTMNYSAQNVISNPLKGDSAVGINGGDPGLQLVVRGPTQPGAAISTASLVTSRMDMLYGSFRAAIKYTGEPGTCGSIFWYHNETSEIDVELLSSKQKPSGPNPVFLVLHAKNTSPSKFPDVPFNPSSGFHEYRFDWSPDEVTYYVDSSLVAHFTTGVPSDPGRLILNHWSNGDPMWTHGPPGRDAVMEVAYVKAYFNTSKGTSGSTFGSQCVKPSAPGAVCQVPDQHGPPSPDQQSTFLTSDAQPEPLVPVSSSQSVGAAPTRLPVAASSMAAKKIPAPSVPSRPAVKNVTPNAQCGGAQGYTCLGSQWGNCCSSHGWCGSKPAYCGHGCQLPFGQCDGDRRRMASR